MRCFSVQLIPPVHLFKQKKKQQKTKLRDIKIKKKNSHNNKHHEAANSEKEKIIIKILTFLMLCISLPIIKKKNAKRNSADGNSGICALCASPEQL